jgi:Fe-S cluster assembly iron-binding protein IscA
VIAITDRAASAIRKMTNTDLYPDAGLRIKSLRGNRYAMTVVPQPAHDDVSVEAAGANVYLDQGAVEKLDHSTLDAAADAWSAAQFSLSGASSPPPPAVLGCGALAWLGKLSSTAPANARWCVGGRLCRC